jgi:hypothetical protein
MKHHKNIMKAFYSTLLTVSLLIVMLFATFWEVVNTSWASELSDEVKIFNPNHIGGASGYNNERDADLYPSVAYDPATGRHLVAWLSARNASSSTSGFDVYGVFLDRDGQPVGNIFRISDTNNVARNGFPAVIAGNGEFAVSWAAKKAGKCQVHIQRVTDASSRNDHVLVSDTGHNHSPSLVFNSYLNRYSLVYVKGDDYQPPTFFGADTADCGNNPSSTSRIETIGFSFSGELPVIRSGHVLSDGSGGAFRPSISYSSVLDQYLVAWEDRRNAGTSVDRFDVYAQRLNNDMSIEGSAITLATEDEYTNFDPSATWTPRPKVAGGRNNFLVAWFRREAMDTAIIWSVNGSLVSADGIEETNFSIAQFAYAQTHADQAPTGYLSAVYSNAAHEYLVGMTSQLESWRGYLSHARIQRVSSSGQLLSMDGSTYDQPNVGHFVDSEVADQITMGITANSQGQTDDVDYLVVYAKHQKVQPFQDFDIWSVRVSSFSGDTVYLPLIIQY